MLRPQTTKAIVNPWRKITIAMLIFGGWLFTASTAAAAPPISNFSIQIPHKSVAPQMEIFTLKITVTVTATPVTFTLNDGTETLSTGSLAAGCTSSSTVFFASTDKFKVFCEGGSKFTIVLDLLSNLGATCLTTNPTGASETWTVSATGAMFDRVCVQSLDKNNGVGGCLGPLRTVPLSEPIAKVLVGGVEASSSLQGCRPPIDAVLVLDRSGSMGSSVTSTDATSKMVRLHQSVRDFMDEWSLLRSNETSMSAHPSIAAVPDRVGVVLFDSTSPAVWLHDVVAASTVTGLMPFSDAIRDDIRNNITSVAPNSATSIGSGLRVADGAFTLTGGGQRKVIVLMSDGMENTPPTTSVAGGVVSTVSGGTTTPLSNLGPPTTEALRIYTLTVGNGSGIVDAGINQAIANATGGVMKNTETDATALRSFYLEVLQNM
ncbi:MAG TPA: vWA domain-containing protein, partial [Pyrinomonadaceae bacterium]|nr:vWA domain-containing protein [Pyrinomonadaceae bacterium]